MQSFTKSTGVTETERTLAEFCERSFLKLWSYPNPYKDDGHELCDLLAVFGNYVFIFFDRNKPLPMESEKDPQVLWERWKREVIDRQINTAHGAARYIQSSRKIFLDAARVTPFPIEISAKDATIYKIIIAHGAKEACLQSSEHNIYGSLAVSYSDDGFGGKEPFHLGLEKKNPVHVFDSHNMPILLGELDTVEDIANFLKAKENAIQRYDRLYYCGEEDLLAHYLFNYDKATARCFIGAKKNDFNYLMIEEGQWHDLVNSGRYRHTKQKNTISYFWDELIQRTCQNALEGTLGGNSDLLRGHSAIFEMVREPRFVRRSIADKMKNAVVNFPDHPSGLSRQVTFIPSYRSDVGYVFFQLRVTEEIRTAPDYLEKRRTILEIACGAAKNKFSHLNKVIGIGMDAPKFAGATNSEDFILLPCEEWTAEQRAHYEERNQDWNFFGTPHLKQYKEHVTQFVEPPKSPLRRTQSRKTGRNDPCPCGSGRKYKKCHGS